MRTSIATVCLSGTLEEKLRATARAGFDGVEIFEQDLVVSPDSPEAIAELARELGISLDLYQPFRDLEGVDEAQFEKNLKRAETKFRLMTRLGIDTMLLCSNVDTATIADDGVVVEQLRRLGDLADRYGVDIAYEALAWGRFVSEYDHAWDLVKSADHPRIGTCLDSFHILSRNTDLSRIAEIPGDKIFFLQLADAPALTMDVLSWSRHHRVFPGEGAWDLGDFLSRVAATGYSGPVSLEVFNDSFRQGDTTRTAVDGLRSLRWLEASIADQAASPADGSSSSPAVDPAAGLDLQPLPEVEEPRGINYVELSTDDLGTLTRQMHQLGFQLIGYHRSKPHVQLWLRGRARIIVSEKTEEVGTGQVGTDEVGTGQVGTDEVGTDGTGTDGTGPGDVGPGTTSVPVNGTFLRGIGFDVADSRAAMERAALLHAVEVPREQAHNDEVLRGVFAPDGSEVFFHQSSPMTPAWITEFGHDHDDQSSHIDHVNLAQPSNHYDEAVLFYTSLLSLHAQSSQDVPSPSGLIRSQVMSSTDGSVRMPLNVSPQQNAEAVAGRAIGSLVEAYPEHVAVACEDIFHTAAAAVSRGLDFLPVPQNYYEDLDSRFDLDPEFLQRLQENHILYDRDGRGEFLHFYTATIGSVFFEMIERRGDYLGFGAPDAPVRLAAQHRKNRQLSQ